MNTISKQVKVITTPSPLQVRGTIFNELDEERPRRRINFAEFEEKFRLGGAVGAAPDPDSDTLASFPSKRFRKPDTVSLLEHTRLRNIGMVFLMWFYE